MKHTRSGEDRKTEVENDKGHCFGGAKGSEGCRGKAIHKSTGRAPLLESSRFLKESYPHTSSYHVLEVTAYTSRFLAVMDSEPLDTKLSARGLCEIHGLSYLQRCIPILGAEWEPISSWRVHTLNSFLGHVA